MESPRKRPASSGPPLGEPLASVERELVVSRLPEDVVRLIMEFVYGHSLSDPVFFHENIAHIMDVYYLFMDHARGIEIRPVLMAPPEDPSEGSRAIAKALFSVAPEISLAISALRMFRDSTTRELHFRVLEKNEGKLTVLAPVEKGGWKPVELTKEFVVEMAKRYPNLNHIWFKFDSEYAEIISGLSQFLSTINKEARVKRAADQAHNLKTVVRVVSKKTPAQGPPPRDLDLVFRSYWVVFDTPHFASWGGPKPRLLHLKTEHSWDTGYTLNMSDWQTVLRDIGLDLTRTPLNLRIGSKIEEIDSIGNAEVVFVDPVPPESVSLIEDIVKRPPTLVEIKDTASDPYSSRLRRIPPLFLFECGNFRTLDSPGPIQIGYEAFMRSGISHISFDNCRYIDQGAFEDCTNMETVKFSYVDVAHNYAVSIGVGAFTGCANLVSVVGYASLIRKSAFRECRKLTTLSLNNSGRPGIGKLGDIGITIENNAFTGCEALKTLELISPALGTEVFSYCTGLETVSIDGSETLTANLFYGCTSLCEFSAEYVDWIEEGAFSHCAALSKVYLKDVLFDERTFFGFPELNSVTVIRRNVPAKAFANCPKLTKFTGARLVSIAPDAFMGCAALSELTLENSKITDGMFAGFPGLTKVTVTGGDIPQKAFADCGKLQIFTGKNIRFIGPLAFQRCGTKVKTRGAFSLIFDTIKPEIADDAFQEANVSVKLQAALRPEKRSAP